MNVCIFGASSSITKEHYIRSVEELGRILAILLEHVLKYPEQNTAECLEKMAREEDDRSSVSGGKSGKNDASK